MILKSFFVSAFVATMLLWEAAAKVRFDTPSLITCKLGAEDVDVASFIGDNCSKFDERHPSLCSFTWGLENNCVGRASLNGCDYSFDTGRGRNNISTVRFLYSPENAPCKGTFAVCGDTCQGESGKLFGSQGPIDIFCPAPGSDSSDSSSCTMSYPYDEYLFVTNSTHANGTLYSIKSNGIDALCSENCSSSTSWKKLTDCLGHMVVSVSAALLLSKLLLT